MAAWRSTSEQKTPRRSRRFESLAKKPSTAFSQELEVGVKWKVRHPRWTFHFTPTSSSWLNAVEGFFAKLSKRRLRRGVFCSLVDLQAAINRFLAEHNQSPKPFVWRADPNAIIAARARGFQTLESNH